ncbi:PQQ-binding-like beta-propeller repeat protein [Actinoplanes sp. NPDC049548]|uniref:outer membrane protein assembly factor BamB family protein n=1 Tax=Actinoplanes sp. NPDC049548 TaxID=3155152 RepID=UPI00341F3992
MALIELSPGTPAPPAAASPPPAYVYRRAGLLLAVVLLLALGGAAPASAMIWRRNGLVPLPDDGDFQLFGGRLYTISFGAGPPRIRALTTDPVRELWTVTGPPGDEERPYYVSDAAGGVVMIRAAGATTVLDAKTGAVRWHTSNLVQRLGGDATGLLQQERFRPGTEYDPESGDPGRLYGYAGDGLHTEPALSTTLSGVDLGTGRRLWSATIAGSVSTQAIGVREAFAVLSADLLTVRSAGDGAVQRQRAMPRVDGRGPVWFEAIGDILLVHYGDFGQGGRVAAYAQDTLEPLWQRDEADPQGSAVACVALPCARSRTEVAVLDPRTGAPLWRAGAGIDLSAFGTDAVLEARSTSRPLRIADRRTGKTRADLRYWMTYTASPGSDAYLVTRYESATRSTVTGLLRPGAAAVQPLGRIPDTNGECRLDDATVACRVPHGIEIYHHLG